MSLVLDTNIFVAIVTGDTDRSSDARRLLNLDRDFYSSIYSIMEVRNVLATKYNFERDRIEAVENTIRTYANPVPHSSILIQEADTIQQSTYVTAMDAIMLASAEHIDGTLVSFDKELHGHGAVTPEKFS